MELHPITMTKLSLLEAGQFINRQVVDIRSLDGLSSLTDLGLADYLTELDTRQTELNIAMTPVRKSDETIKIEALDNKRDLALSFLKKAAAMFEISDVADEQDACRSLKTLFSGYKNLEKLNYEAESRGIDNLLNDLGNSKYGPMVELLNLAPYAARLQETNEAFKIPFSDRNQETAQKETFDAQQLKKGMFVVYNDFAGYVLAMAKVTHSNPLYKDMLNLLNATRKYYADMLARRKGVTAEAPTV